MRSLGTAGGSVDYAHFYAGPTVLYQVAKLGDTVNHVGGGNSVRGRWTLGIEQAGRGGDGPTGPQFTRQQWLDCGIVTRQTAPLITSLIRAGHGAPVWLSPADLDKPGVRGITSHNNMRVAFGGTSHTDPGANYPVDVLMSAVTAELGRTTTAPTTLSTPTQETDDMILIASTGPAAVPNATINTVYSIDGIEKSALSPAALASWNSLIALEASTGGPYTVKNIGRNDARVALSPHTVEPTKMPGDA